MNTEIPEVLQKAIRFADEGYDRDSRIASLLEVVKYQNEQIKQLRQEVKNACEANLRCGPL